MRKTLVYLAFVCASAFSTSSWAALACTLTASNVSGIYSSGSNRDLTGSLDVNCTRALSDSSTQTAYIAIGPGLNASKVKLQTAATTLNYAIYRNSNFTGQWTTGTGRPQGDTNSGGLLVTGSFGSATTLSASLPYYLRVPSGQTGKAAGIYDDTGIAVTMRLNSASGALLSSDTMTANLSILTNCRFSVSPAALSISYTSFATAAQTGSTTFGVSCTMSTPYTLALSATSGTLMGLNYTLALSATSGTGTGFQQNYTVNANVVPGQIGTCTTSACTASQARTLTISY